MAWHFRAFGFPNNVETFGLVSGLWTSTFALGAFIGPSIAGFLYDQIGFRQASLFVLVTHLVVGALVTVFIMFGRRSAVYVEIGKEDKIPLDSEHSNYPSMQTNENDSIKRFVEDFLKESLVCQLLFKSCLSVLAQTSGTDCFFQFEEPTERNIHRKEPPCRYKQLNCVQQLQEPSLAKERDKFVFKHLQLQLRGHKKWKSQRKCSVSPRNGVGLK